VNQRELRAWRTLRELTLTELGDLLGVNRKTVWRWENGDTSMPPFLPLALERLDETRPRPDRRRQRHLTDGAD
jgi:transcriptional regulator with XRE-family HTH domain